MPPATVQVTDATFQAEVLESDVPVLVDFTAAWCPPCRVMKPILAELAEELPDVLVRVELCRTDDNLDHSAAPLQRHVDCRRFLLVTAAAGRCVSGAPELDSAGARPEASRPVV
jgi:hypothetical protein